jgi:hypothetical protein
VAALPKPVPGLVIRYSYLWNDEHKKGQEEGVKDRPCAIVLMTKTEEDVEVVTVLPVTHSPPADSDLAVEIPQATKMRLNLDAQTSWIVLSEMNRFSWPGPDLRPAVRGDMATVAYGSLPAALFEQVKNKMLAAITSGKFSSVARSE